MSLGNKQIMANNIKRLLDQRGLNGRQLALTLGFKYTTVNDWLNAKTYPRIDKIEKMANFFGVEKSDLIEEYKPLTTAFSPDFEEKYTEYIEEFVNMFNSLTKKQQSKLYKEIAKTLKEKGASTENLRKPDDLVTNLINRQKEFNRLAEIRKAQDEEILRLEEEKRVAEIALEILSIDEDDIEAQKAIRVKYSEEDLYKAVDYIENLENYDDENSQD